MPLAHSLGGVPAYLAGLTDPSKSLGESDVDRLLKTQYHKAESQHDWTVNDRHDPFGTSRRFTADRPLLRIQPAPAPPLILANQ